MRLWRRFWGSFCSPFSKQDYFDLEEDLTESLRDTQVMDVALGALESALKKSDRENEVLNLENKKLKEELSIWTKRSAIRALRLEAIEKLVTSSLDLPFARFPWER